jgi:hypothetical protein
MKKKIYKDHVNDMFKADGIKKDADKTNYQQNYGNCGGRTNFFFLDWN